MANLLCSKVRNYKECKVLAYLRLYKSGGLVSFWIIDISIASIRYLMCQKNGTNLVSLYCQFFQRNILTYKKPQTALLVQTKVKGKQKMMNIDIKKCSDIYSIILLKLLKPFNVGVLRQRQFRRPLMKAFKSFMLWFVISKASKMKKDG